MVSEPPPTIDCSVNVAAEQPAASCLHNNKNQGKLPKKIHKAEREKLKRDKLNVLFLELGHALEPALQNSGKACILTDANRILRDLILQVESLGKENVALVTESCYVTVEKNELKEENMALAAEIARLRSELQERLHSDPTWQNSGTDQPIPAQPTTAAMPPLYVLPYHQDLQNLPETAMTLSPPNPAPQVRKPHARYPTQADSWPLQILSRHRRSSSSSNSKNEGSEKA
uniref:BHLH transcription factor n=1 Tax=Dracaena cambodiana TaxID=580341 RepID=A0A7M3UQL9_9ASPA|nr:bHLH transcription factor [Dracaena cambodiana]